ncbi:MAG: GNAT family N-acetyltransferase [Planctomycetota bacterium]
MTIRTLNSDDAEEYHSVRLAALNERPPAFGPVPEEEPTVATLRSNLPATRDRVYFGAFENTQLVGIARLSRYSGSNEKHRAYLAGLYVSPPCRRRGFGRQLVDAALDHALSEGDIIRVNLTVGTGQEPALRLYQSRGFTICGIDLDVFSCDGAFYDEHRMTLDLRADPRTA